MIFAVVAAATPVAALTIAQFRALIRSLIRASREKAYVDDTKEQFTRIDVAYVKNIPDVINM